MVQATFDRSNRATDVILGQPLVDLISQLIGKFAQAACNCLKDPAAQPIVSSS